MDTETYQMITNVHRVCVAGGEQNRKALGSTSPFSGLYSLLSPTGVSRNALFPLYVCVRVVLHFVNSCVYVDKFSPELFP